jgi:hypothetical protein
MSRYIDIAPLIKEIADFKKSINSPNSDYMTGYICAISVTEGIIANQLLKQSTADVVEVVRKPVKGYEGYYEVDQFGRVYSIDRLISVDDNGRQYNKVLGGKQMKQGMHSKGYKIVSLTKEGKTKTVFVHRIVAEAFISNENDLPMVNHKDEDKTNNFVENLEWCTAKYNRSYGKAIEKHSKKIKGRKHTEEHKQKISEGVKRSYGERSENGK